MEPANERVAPLETKSEETATQGSGDVKLPEDSISGSRDAAHQEFGVNFEGRPIFRINESLFIGNRKAARDCDLLRVLGIKSILALDGTFNGTTAAQLGVDAVASFQPDIGAENPFELVDQILRCLRGLECEHSPVLIQCRAGGSRSPAIVARYLMEQHAWSAPDAIRFIEVMRDANIMPGLNEVI